MMNNWQTINAWANGKISDMRGLKVLWICSKIEEREFSSVRPVVCQVLSMKWRETRNSTNLPSLPNNCLCSKFGPLTQIRFHWNSGVLLLLLLLSKDDTGGYSAQSQLLQWTFSECQWIVPIFRIHHSNNTRLVGWSPIAVELRGQWTGLIIRSFEWSVTFRFSVVWGRISSWLNGWRVVVTWTGLCKHQMMCCEGKWQ